jgi:hypothetical protein
MMENKSGKEDFKGSSPSQPFILPIQIKYIFKNIKMRRNKFNKLRIKCLIQISLI